MSQENKNIIETVLEAQQKMVDNAIEATKKVANGNTFVAESMDKGKEMYKNWLEQQKKAFAGTSEKMDQAKESFNENMDKASSYFQNWLNGQLELIRKTWEANQNFLKGGFNNDFFTKFNPTDAFSQWMKWANPWQNNNPWQNWMSQFNSMGNGLDAFKNFNNQYATFFNQYQEMMRTSFAQLSETIQNPNAKDVFANMMNVTKGFTKFCELWAPFWKSIQEKTFNAEQFKKAFDMESYKELMNNFFGFNTEDGKQYFQQMTDLYQQGMKQMAGQGRDAYQQWTAAMSSMNPFAGQEPFATVLNAYQSMQQALANGIAPIAKIATPNTFTKNAQEWAQIFDQTAIYNIKNAELQYMIYQHGQKVLDALVDNITKKMEEGVEINNITALYQEWLNTSDQVYVSLFESDEYSKLMAEVSALQLKLRKSYQTQIEKSLEGFPVATKSELDELYKIIYDLKKEVRQLEKMLELNNNSKPAAEAMTTATGNESSKGTKRGSSKKQA